MKTVLLPTDFSDNAWKAASYAANLYRGIPCRFVMIHAYYTSGIILEVDISKYISTMIKDINRQMTSVQRAFEEFDHHPETTIETVSRYGVAANVIDDQAKNNFADMIVMGIKGNSNISNVAIGSTAIEVISDVKCPVICIPERAEITPPEHIMLATDYNNVTNLKKLLVLKEIAEMHNSGISIVHVKEEVKVPVAVEDELEPLVLHNFFGETVHEYFEEQEDAVEVGILNFAHRKNVDLIVLLNRDRTFWDGLFHRSITKKVELQSDVPLLVLKD